MLATTRRQIRLAPDGQADPTGRLRPRRSDDRRRCCRESPACDRYPPWARSYLLLRVPSRLPSAPSRDDLVLPANYADGRPGSPIAPVLRSSVPALVAVTAAACLSHSSATVPKSTV